MSRPTTGCRLPEPTICDLTCFFPRGHEGRCQQWRGAPCDVIDCEQPSEFQVQGEDYRSRRYLCRSHKHLDVSYFDGQRQTGR